MRYIHKLVNERTTNSEKRKHFIAEKVESSPYLNDVPEEWRGSLLYFFNKYMVNTVKQSAKQTLAWNELKDSQFLFFNMIHQPQYHADLWIKKLENIHNRLNKALQQKHLASSLVVQAIVQDVALLYTNSGKSSSLEDFFRYFAENSLALTERMERFDTLCSIISPKSRQFSKGNVLLLQAIPYKLQQMQQKR
ncbi:hypothetical protein A8L34_14055 [Bacillus sp. FJAT-27264]|uniref:hypothetical protein n=1 Tax=Paenibacillus sp. (strain DSM 101736 / FJAT-27264) TaxID=1850362 RepID=UPI000807C15C|nr:hypothetical protein [Bacillus sp. FJAT-27264]OBZ14999.1 hypothetical protein A8L34_14055 [Bacillus sp. FJAT-27264]